MSRVLIAVIAIACILSCVYSPAHAATIRVFQDGTGDYTDLQAGIDAAAPGDTILIGAGRYDLIQTFDYSTGLPAEAIAYIGKPDLSLIGVDVDSVVIGPAIPTDWSNGEETNGIITDIGGTGLHLRKLTVENLNIGVFINQDSATITDCIFQDGFTAGLFCRDARGVRVFDTRFPSVRGNQAVVGRSMDGLVFKRCDFVWDTPHSRLVEGMTLGACSNVEVDSCVFEGYRASVFMWGGGSGTVTNNEFRGWADGIGSADPTNLGVQAFHTLANVAADVSNNVVSEHHENSFVFKQSMITGHGNVLAGAHVRTLNSDGGATARITFNNNRIGRGGQFSAEIGMIDSDSTAADLRFNDWGSNDISEIWTWIRSAQDFDPDGIGGFIDPMIEPIEQTVPTQSGTVGRMKGRFRGSQAVKN